MDLTQTAFGTWGGGRFMHFGEAVDDQRFIALIQLAHQSGIRTFITSDVYGVGRADEMLGKALEGIDRDSYCLVGMLGHDIYEGKREGSRGYPRFTDSALRARDEYTAYLKMATEKSLERCRAESFDLVMLHNPDERGYADASVWEAMSALKETGLAARLGIAPGPANGFTLDLIHSFEQFGELIDWAMIILNPLEPWPGRLTLDAAVKAEVKVLTRVVDYGGLFHGTMKAGHAFRDGDHRAYRPDGWVEAGLEKIEAMRPVIERHGLSMLQFASLWNLAHAPVESVAPTFIQEAGEDALPVEDLLRDFAAMPGENPLSVDEVEQIARAGDNTGCMILKGASKRHEESLRPDEWPMRSELLELAGRHGLGEEW